MKFTKRTRLTALAAAASAVILLAIGGTSAYLTDVEAQNNVITIGSVKTKLTETSYVDSQTVVAGSIVPKDPMLENTGRNDEYVFLKVDVPKASVTLLYEADEGTEHKRGEIRKAKSVQQLFKVLTTASGTSSVTAPNANTDLVFYYNNNTSSADGWVLISSDYTGTAADSYVFGYSKKLAPNDKTATLFDKVQLKSFIDGEIPAASSEKKILVTGYAIQDRNLGIDGLDEPLSAEKLTAIYEIVNRKAAQSNGS